MLDLRHLPHQLPDEKPVYFLRRHPITLIPLILGYLSAIIIPLLAYAYLQVAQPQILENPPLFATIVMLGSALFLFVWLFLFQAFLDYYLDIWVVTTRRVLNIEQTGLFNRTISELRLYRVQDVTATVKGVLHTIFNYGDVEIQTAGEKIRFLFEEVPQPNEVAKTILQLAEQDRQNHLDETVEELGKPNNHRRAHLGEIEEP